MGFLAESWNQMSNMELPKKSSVVWYEWRNPHLTDAKWKGPRLDKRGSDSVLAKSSSKGTEEVKYALQNVPAISSKLGDDNFLPWRMQALATIKGHRLYKYLLGEKHVPQRYLTAKDLESGVYSDDFLFWESQDQLLKVADALAAIGLPVSKHDHIEAILDGLGEDYEGFITSFSMRKDDYNVSEIEALLLAQEARVEKVKKHVENVYANIAQRGFS
ncbi:Retrovirus-related Pol polyprotein from transposon RE1 [Senna tora]|uniref:Retrovirus-related Pol polyprotein from transposon RE1 n=1 Tax=Senna tora TaxID=362788 RepID=A0A834SVH2_9FABA|nr:Retrovirus-related Pol polyprotein from transposon RE1 [Senna tora]